MRIFYIRSGNSTVTTTKFDGGQVEFDFQGDNSTVNRDKSTFTSFEAVHRCGNSTTRVDNSTTASHDSTRNENNSARHKIVHINPSVSNTKKKEIGGRFNEEDGDDVGYSLFTLVFGEPGFCRVL
ncbi:hypothetical protein ACIQXQ_16640 [Peribacillus sp. NPDC097198]|uniref:hypothetical protein n=1 Tax=Peribacillus sp. NPDC097198 TaxID=3364397 RepID=UPI003819BC38